MVRWFQSWQTSETWSAHACTWNLLKNLKSEDYGSRSVVTTSTSNLLFHTHPHTAATTTTAAVLRIDPNAWSFRQAIEDTTALALGQKSHRILGVALFLLDVHLQCGAVNEIEMLPWLEHVALKPAHSERKNQVRTSHNKTYVRHNKASWLHEYLDRMRIQYNRSSLLTQFCKPFQQNPKMRAYSLHGKNICQINRKSMAFQLGRSPNKLISAFFIHLHFWGSFQQILQTSHWLHSYYTSITYLYIIYTIYIHVYIYIYV